MVFPIIPTQMRGCLHVGVSYGGGGGREGTGGLKQSYYTHSCEGMIVCWCEPGGGGGYR